MIVGIDFSLTATGVCAIDEAEAECVTFGSESGEWWTFGERPREIAAAMDKWHGGDRPAWVIESPSYMSSGRGHDKVLVGWHIFVDFVIYELGYDPPLLVSPSQLKKFVAGKGNVGKDEMNFAIARRYPDVDVKNNNEADALGLAAIGAAVMGEPFNGTLNQKQLEVVAAVAAGKERK